MNFFVRLVEERKVTVERSRGAVNVVVFIKIDSIGLV